MFLKALSTDCLAGVEKFLDWVKGLYGIGLKIPPLLIIGTLLLYHANPKAAPS